MAAAVDMAGLLTLQTQQQQHQQQLEDNMDTYFDFNQGDFHSPNSASPDPNTSSLDSTVPSQQSEYVEQQQRHYNGPSHQYDLFRQQTGLPTGAVSHMAAINGYSAPSQSSDSFSHMSMGYNSGLEFDSLGYAGEGTSSQNMSYFYSNDSLMDEFIEPSAVDNQPQPPAMRLRPGMHSQQAQQKQQTSQQQTVPSQQQQKQQQNSAGMNAQRPLPQAQQQTPQQTPQQTRIEEPQLNSQISRLLNQMRHGSIASSHSDTSLEADGNEGIPTVQKTRKDEDDMDEDERLLASEEGKKLSSKERRQLRNKVSARAFRSRRKEYISQLEAEVAARSEEAANLRNRNNHLFVQNQQLQQLTQAMLNHHAFETFMQDLSRNPNMLQQQAAQQQQQQQPKQPKQAQPQSQPESQSQKQEQAPRNNDIMVGMTRIPEPNLDFSMLNLGANDGGNGNTAFGQMPFNNFQTPQIFAVHSVPQGPSAEDLATERFLRKPELPLIPELPRLSEKEHRPLEIVSSVERTDASISDLYSDAPVSHSASPVPSSPASFAALSKPTRFVTVCIQDESTLLQQLEQLLAPAEITCRILARLT